MRESGRTHPAVLAAIWVVLLLAPTWLGLVGTLLGGLTIGVAAALTAVVWPAASDVVVYVIMAIVLLVRPRGFLGEEGMQ